MHAAVYEMWIFVTLALKEKLEIIANMNNTRIVNMFSEEHVGV